MNGVFGLKIHIKFLLFGYISTFAGMNVHRRMNSLKYGHFSTEKLWELKKN